MNLRVLPAANGDVTEALSWLVARGWYGAIGRLWTAWEAALDDIAATPRRFSPVDDAPPGREVRFCLILKARYRIIFQVLPDEIRVVAFCRSNRSNEFWLGRLSTP